MSTRWSTEWLRLNKPASHLSGCRKAPATTRSTLLSVIGHQVPKIDLGTSVVPTYPRHPLMLAAEALTANQAVGGRLLLGIGLSHKMSIEPRYGMSYDKPARHMREYLSILLPAMRDGSVDFEGEVLTGRGQVSVPDAAAPPVLLAALQPNMLKLAGSMADGTVTWCTGRLTVEEQIVPIITAAAVEASRPAPRVIVALPVVVTDDESDGRAKADKQLDGYGRIPVYRAVLDREGAAGPGTCQSSRQCGALFFAASTWFGWSCWPTPPG